jgi:hypothetical protein
LSREAHKRLEEALRKVRIPYIRIDEKDGRKFYYMMGWRGVRIVPVETVEVVDERVKVRSESLSLHNKSLPDVLRSVYDLYQLYEHAEYIGERIFLPFRINIGFHAHEASKVIIDGIYDKLEKLIEDDSDYPYVSEITYSWRHDFIRKDTLKNIIDRVEVSKSHRRVHVLPASSIIHADKIEYDHKSRILYLKDSNSNLIGYTYLESFPRVSEYHFNLVELAWGKIDNPRMRVRFLLDVIAEYIKNNGYLSVIIQLKDQYTQLLLDIVRHIREVPEGIAILDDTYLAKGIGYNPEEYAALLASIKEPPEWFPWLYMKTYETHLDYLLMPLGKYMKTTIGLWNLKVELVGLLKRGKRLSPLLAIHKNHNIKVLLEPSKKLASMKETIRNLIMNEIRKPVVIIEDGVPEKIIIPKAISYVVKYTLAVEARNLILKSNTGSRGVKLHV